MHTRPYSRYAPFILRLVLGITFILHGWPKLTDAAGPVKFFESLGIPIPEVAVMIVGLVEVVGGLALLLGLWVELFAALLAIDMLVAIMTAKSGTAWVGGFELELLLLAASLSLIFSGAGAWALTRSRGASRRANRSR